jgi:hypothetical protein
MTLDRRRFLQLAATGMVAGLTTSACASDTGEDAAALGKPALVEMLGPERAREIGTQYRASVRTENTEAALRDAISRSRGRQFLRIGNRSIEEQIRDDFAAARTVVVNGWVLSQTEARQCALYSLSV